MNGHITNRLTARVPVVRKNLYVAVHRPVPQIAKQPAAVAALVRQPDRQVVQQRAIAIQQTVATPRSVAVPVRRKNLQQQRTRQQQQQPQSRSQQILPRRQPKYITADVSREDLEQIKNIRGLGRNRVLVIVGNGPSVNEVDLRLLANQPDIDIMSINKPDSRVWPSRYWMFCDLSQLRRHRSLWENYNGTIFNSTSIGSRRPGTIQMKNLGGTGFSRDLFKGYHIGRSSVFAAMQIALWLDYAHVYIVGCDMCAVNGQMHFYGVNPDVDPETRQARFAAEADHYDKAADILNEHERKKYTFCSSYLDWPFAERFNKIDHKVAVETILAAAKSENRNV